MRKTLEGEGTPFRRGFLLPPNLPHLPRTSPQDPPSYERKFGSLLESGGVLRGSFLSVGEVWAFYRVRLSHTIGGWLFLRGDARNAPWSFRFFALLPFWGFLQPLFRGTLREFYSSPLVRPKTFRSGTGSLAVIREAPCSMQKRTSSSVSAQ